MATASAVVGHELFHKKSLFHKVTGTLIFAKIYYSQFYTSHIKFHHKLVATEEDPSTARLGESLN